MAVLHAAARAALPASDFAGPGRSYPIPDEAHARAALSLVDRYGSPAEKTSVHAAVQKRYPHIHQQHMVTTALADSMRRG